MRDKAEVSFVYLTTHVSLMHSEKTLDVQNRGLRAPVYARVGLFIGGRQGLHRFTCVKAARRTRTHHRPGIEPYLPSFVRHLVDNMNTLEVNPPR